MKKILLGTTAIIALATVSTEAFAAEKVKIGISGVMSQFVGLTNHDEVAATGNNTARKVKLQQWDRSRLQFSGTTTLDNGLAVKVYVQSGASKNGGFSGAEDQNGGIRQSYAEISSDTMGAFTIGKTTHAGNDMRVAAPNAGIFDFGDTNQFAGVSDAAGTASTAYTDASAVDVTGMGGRDGKLKYVSPSFSGFTVFGSYSVAEGTGFSTATASTADRNAANDGSTFGVAYSGEVSGAAISADLTQLRVNGSYEQTHVGVNVGMAGFTVGGGYANMNDDTGVSGPNDGTAWEFGVGYETGPYSLSAGYMTSKSRGTVAAAGDNKDKKYLVAGAYDLGAGVKATATYFNSKSDPENTGAAATFATGKSAKVSGVLAGIQVSF